MNTTLIDGLTTTLKVGLEIHVELATRTKMWTAAPNVAHPDHFEAGPNTLLDPVVIGLPGTLPVINRAAVEMAARVGLALHCQIAPFTKWDRKSYYYPDLPKNYQISQYDLPLCAHGHLDIPLSDEPDAPTKRIRVLRAHLEEDAGKLLHEAPGGYPIDYSIVDLNRAGTPLLEIVTEPDFDSADQVVIFGQMLRNICRFLGVSEGIMQMGHMRFEPNINVIIQQGDKKIATPIVEIKNLNSFKAVHGAIQHEHRRQVEQYLKDGKAMVPGSKSTRGWDDVRLVTFLQREKEEAHDYRYFPDPDLLPVTIDEPWLDSMKTSIPELPLSRRNRYIRELGLTARQAGSIVEERDVCLLFDAMLTAGLDGKRAAAILLNNLARLANERGVLPSDLGITAQQIAAIDQMQQAGKISSNGADELYRHCAEAGSGADPVALAESRGLLVVSDDGALDAWAQQVIDANGKIIDQIRGGNEKAIMSLVGQVMKLSGGKANPKAVQEKLRTKIMG
jgi:aspartyl-tRNA(Asn)/glutamyl-tRNA(Gln) amidotransferase subunit B